MTKEPTPTTGDADTTPQEAPSAPAKNLEQKVALDLDDAPFLEEEKETPPPPKKTEPSVATAAEPQPKQPAQPLLSSLKDRLLAHKKKIILAGIAAVVLVAVALVLNIFIFGKPAPAPAPPPPPPPAAPAPAPSPPPAPPKPTVLLMQWEPFWVEVKDTEGAIRFLTCKMSIPTENPILFAEMQARKLILRDAVFYYLRNQIPAPLTDQARVDIFKNEVLIVLNEHLSSGKIAEVLIENYIIQ